MNIEELQHQPESLNNHVTCSYKIEHEQLDLEESLRSFSEKDASDVSS